MIRSLPKNRPRYSFLNVLTGSDLSRRRLALMEVHSETPGPTVWLTGAVHGEEVGSMVIIQEIFKRLKKEPLRAGSLYALPLMNPIGFETGARGLPLSEEDLNRSFPGNPRGSIAERVAHKIFTTITATNPSLVLDLHNDWSESIPYTLIDPDPGPKFGDAYFTAKKIALKAGFIVINEQENEKQTAELQKTLSGSLLHHHVPSLTLELGGAYVVLEMNVRLGIHAIWSILADRGMVGAPELSEVSYRMPPEFSGKILHYSRQPVVETSGIIRFMVKAGAIVQKDQPVARVYNVFGKLQETIRATSHGIVLGHADSSVAFPGTEVFAFGII
ncbi:MAG: succinylglutamate desuccinylase/aspartoacylase family protein [Parcubacteria group bacterium]|nr:succinylglutamate desuccinylase/aspartoacylase family protein [Parcubacteria group bacterium]